MTEQPQYSSLLVQHLVAKFFPSFREAALAHPIGKMFWKAIEPQIPEWLAQLDENKEMQEGIIKHLREFMNLLEEDNPEKLELMEETKEEIKRRLDKLGIEYSEEPLEEEGGE